MQLPSVVRLVLPVVLAVGACTDAGPRLLADFPPTKATLDVDVRAPEERAATTSARPSFQTWLEIHSADCPFLDPSAHASLDTRPVDELERGHIEPTQSHGETRDTCIPPQFYVHDPLPPAQHVSVVTLADDSATFRISVERLLVNPELSVGELTAGTQTVARILDDRPVAFADVSFLPDGTDPRYPIVATDTQIVGDEIRFTTPAANGPGTLSIALTMIEHQIDCDGFVQCEATTYGGRRFARTISSP